MHHSLDSAIESIRNIVRDQGIQIIGIESDRKMAVRMADELAEKLMASERRVKELEATVAELEKP